MGSVFFIVVPIRSFELKLRLIENDIFSAPVASVQAPEADTDQVIVDAMRRLNVRDLEDQSLLAKDIPIPPTKDHITSYNLNKNGPLLLQLTRDTMKLMRGQSVDPSDGKVRRVSIVAGQEILDPDSDENLKEQRKSTESYDDLTITELIDSKFLERHIEDVLQKFELLSASWETSIDGKFSRICYCVDSAKADRIISHLHAIGIGKKYESTISVCATSVFTQERSGGKRTSLDAGGGIGDYGSDDEVEAAGRWNNFVQSIKARITVAQVVENVRANAVITFDFLVMLVVAGIIAALGLLENSSVNLIASMLVSPLMGPIMAFTFGAMIRDMSLIKIGVVSELIGLFICLIIGFIFGIFLEAKPINGPWAKVKQWPTGEMSSRGRHGALLVGAAIAIPSGAGVALSILAGNAGSLVGVAISASLLPPCVNCGIFYGLALVIAIREGMSGRDPFTVACQDKIENIAENSTYFANHEPFYCQNPLREFALMGTFSLCLTLLNIVLIFFTGLLILKIKEVAPYTTKTAFERFWKHDVKHARDYNAAHSGEDTLLSDLAEDQMLLNKVQDDYVFNQIKRRHMYREENIIAEIKEKKSKVAVDGGWFGGWFAPTASKTGEDVEAKKSIRGKKNVVHPQKNRKSS